MLPISAGLDLSNLEETSKEEIEAHLLTRWEGRGPLYDLYASSLMLDYQPDFAKLHWLGADNFRLHPDQSGNQLDPPITIPSSLQQLHSYMVFGWETGIRNQFRVLKRWNFKRSQIMEVVLFSRLTAGMRGLGHVYHAIGDVLPDYQDGSGEIPWPEGWTVEPEAFKSGLDLSTRELTGQDRTNLTRWYEANIGYLPNSIRFGMDYDPQVLKNHRAMWETAIKTLPKQVVPYLLLRDATLAGNPEALREAALLGKSWGMSREWIVRGITQTMHYFTGLRGLYTAYEAVDDILRDWE
jgi:hypothetical protein